MKIVDDFNSCNSCRIGRNQIANHSVEDNQLKQCLTICTRCGHREEWKDGTYANEGKCIKIIEQETKGEMVV